MSVRIIVAIVCLAGGFFGGMQYQKSTTSAPGNGRAGFGNFQDLTQEQRDQMRAQFGNGQGGFGGNRPGGGLRINGGGATAGEVIVKDDTSITVKLPDGGSKIVFYSANTQVGHMTQGTMDDVVVGGRVFVNGTQNTDGSMTAQMVQIRPAEVRVDGTH